MNKRNLVVSLVASLLVVAGVIAYLATGARPQLGLDLRGGISAIYSPVLNEGEERPEDFEAVLDETIEVIRARVDSLGVAEPDISRQGEDVLVQLPGLDDPERAQEIIGTTAKLTFRPVEEVLPPGSEEGPDCTQELTELPEDEGGIVCGASTEGDLAEAALGVQKYRVGPAALTGDRIEDALPVLAGATSWSVSLDLDGQGAEQFAEITSELACQRDQGQPGLLAIVLDNVVESAPAMNPEVACGAGIQGGQAAISVGGGLEESEEEARDLALVLKTGALPITLEPSTFDTVSATLGAESLRNGLLAGLIGLAIVAVYLTFFYRVLGLVAISGLLIFAVMMTGLITALGEIGFALTLAGVAGVIVSIGITADSSIIFFERLRDEVALGKTIRTSANKAFSSAFRTNLTGNTSTLAAAIILYMLAVGPVRGFALTLGMATILDIFIMYFFTRPMVGLLAGGGRIGRRSVRAPEPAVAGGAR
ncbi:MAG: protein translocase subunit SecD [Actinobacteria bacterium]|nr:protein translocase subunit SecD [Actinomycetota bacterium]